MARGIVARRANAWKSETHSLHAVVPSAAVGRPRHPGHLRDAQSPPLEAHPHGGVARDEVPRKRRPWQGCVVRFGTMQTRQLTAIIQREGDGYVSLCPEVDVASQGTTIDEARANLIEALELFFETADASEIQSRMHNEVFVTRLEVAVG